MTHAAIKLAVLALFAALAALGCGPEPSATPGDMVTLLNELTAHGTTVRDMVAGDAGCSDPTLRDNATRLQLTLASEERDHTVYLFRWRRQSDYDTAAASFSLCVSEFANRLSSSVRVDTVAASPWRAYGPGWTPTLHDALQQSLEAAAVGE